MTRAGCTIISPNYHAFAKTLSDSWHLHHPDLPFFVLIVADIDLSTKACFEGRGYTPVLLSEIGLADMRSVAMKYDVLELNTNVKPSFLKFLLEAYDLDELVYLDPDICVYSPFTPVFRELESANVVLTPHLTSPICDGKVPGEQEMLYNGTYNLGFIAVRQTAETMRLLDWWEARCLQQGFSEGRTGLFVDQKWMNLAPGLFDGVALLKDPGCNMAYWNLYERYLEEAGDGYRVRGGGALCFYHFSGVVLADSASISRNTDRFTLADRPELRKMFDDYKATVLANAVEEIGKVPYAFDRLSDGTALTRLARRLYATELDRWVGSDPFDAAGPFAIHAKKLKLVTGKSAPSKNTWSEFNPRDNRVLMIHRALRIALRVLGPNRYELLMRYLSHITVLRNQAVFLNNHPN